MSKLINATLEQSRGWTATGEDLHPARLTLGLHTDFTALGRLRREKQHRRLVRTSPETEIQKCLNLSILLLIVFVKRKLHLIITDCASFTIDTSNYVCFVLETANSEKAAAKIMGVLQNKSEGMERKLTGCYHSRSIPSVCFLSQ